MNSQLNQNAIRKIAVAWKGYFKILKDYQKNPSKYKERPNVPGYLRNSQYVAWFSNQTAKYSVEKDGRAYLRFTKNKDHFLYRKSFLVYRSPICKDGDQAAAWLLSDSCDI